MNPKYELEYTQLKNFCDESLLGFKTTADIEAYDGIIGQDRGIKAFNFGLKAKFTGYNIYMSGPSGTGRTTYAKSRTQKIAANEPVPDDWCYVYNFDDPKCPKALRFSPGVGKKFKKDMDVLIGIFTTEILKAVNTEAYHKEKANIVKKFDDKREELINNLTEFADQNGFSLRSTSSGIYFMPVIDGQAIDEDAFDQLDDETKARINDASDVIQEQAAATMRDIRNLDKESKKATDEYDYKVCMFAIGHHVIALQKKYKKYPDVVNHLDSIKEDVLNNISEFTEEEPEEEDAMASLLPMVTKKSSEDITNKYKVNLIVDNSETKGAPVIVDYNPTLYNLMGEVEIDNELGNITTDYLKIKGGLIHKANGGYLILQAVDVLSNAHAWEILRRVLKTKEISVESMREQMVNYAMPSLKANPIPVDIKVILIGSSYHYFLLREYDEEFAKQFKIRADFDYEMDNDNENLSKLARFVKSYSKKEMPEAEFSASAVASIAEYASRVAERQDKFSTCFNNLGEILCEAKVWADMDEAKLITGEHIKKAIAEKDYRNSLIKEKYSEMYDQDVVMIDTKGSRVGQINGLAVLETGECTFGIPSRITVTTYVGKSGIINIEKEAEMSGPTHNKGVQVITGYLGQTYAQDFPLSLSCRVCFEQNYNGIDGDSASSTELYGIISSLSGLPINQQLAVTGSVNQWGEIQAIGGVTYKIEGFFDLCAKKGLTGEQGVIIPESNIRDLVLNDEVIEAVKAKKFHIYPIKHINEGIELLTGVEAGVKDENGNYPENSVHGLVMKKLMEYNRKATDAEGCTAIEA
ncbi:MAG: AAA family ATPase [Firmicutes bacterium]|nr:AAA family ATPase [Bacillota bacterium]